VVGSFVDQNAVYLVERHTETVSFVFNTLKLNLILQDPHLEELVFEETLPQNHVEPKHTFSPDLTLTRQTTSNHSPSGLSLTICVTGS
jgi:hypothetical protein